MGWLAAALVFIFVASLAIRHPAFRRALLAIIAVLGGAAVVAILYATTESTLHAEAEREKWQKVIPWGVQLNLKLRYQPDFTSFRIEGTATNNTGSDISALRISVQIQDCATACVVVGETTTESYVTIPSGQRRAINQSLFFTDVPSISKLSWNYDLLNVRAVE